MDRPVSAKIRVGLLLLAVPQLVTGLWALLAAETWFESFPGIGPGIVAIQPPFNGHLATDAGAGFFATGVVLVVAALWADARCAIAALITYGAFGLPHVI